MGECGAPARVRITQVLNTSRGCRSTSHGTSRNLDQVSPTALISFITGGNSLFAFHIAGASLAWHCSGAAPQPTDLTRISGMLVSSLGARVKMQLPSPPRPATSPHPEHTWCSQSTIEEFHPREDSLY